MWQSDSAAAWVRTSPTTTTGAAASTRPLHDHEVDPTGSSAVSARHRRTIPCSPDQRVPLPPLLRATASTFAASAPPAPSHIAGGAHKQEAHSGAKTRQKVRSNAARQEGRQGGHRGGSARAAPPPSAWHFSKASASTHYPRQHHQHHSSISSHVATPSPVLLRHTFDGTTRVLYADGHVDEFTTAAAEEEGRPLSSAAAAALLPPLADAAEHSQADNAVSRSAASFQSPPPTPTAASAHHSQPALPAVVAVAPPALRSSNGGGTGGNGRGAAAPSPPIVLRAFDAAAGPYHDRLHPLPHSEVSDATRNPRVTVCDNSPSLSLHDVLTAAQPHQQPRRGDAAIASSDGSGVASTKLPSSQSSISAAGTATATASRTTSEVGDSTHHHPTLRDVTQRATLDPAGLPEGGLGWGMVVRQRGVDSEDRVFLTSVPAEVLPLPLEEEGDAAAVFGVPGSPLGGVPPSMRLATRLAELQREIRAEFAHEQQTRAATFASRFERSVHDSPSIFSLACPFRPLHDVYAEAAQYSDGSATTCKGSSSQAGSAPPPPSCGVPDVLLPAAQTITPIGWTLPQLIEQRLLPREASALQHRYSELLALRGLLDTPDSMTCRFGVAFMWFVLLRCRKAHREQALVDGYRRLAKVFTDAFPFSTRDTVPTLDVLGQLLVEICTCVRYEEHTAAYQQQQQQRTAAADAAAGESSQQSQRETAPSDSTALLASAAATRTRTNSAARGAAPQRDIPHYADLSELLACKSLFPLLTGEWAYLLRHGHNAMVAPASATSVTHLQQLQQQQTSALDLSNVEQTQRVSLLPSAKTLYTLCTVYQELWLQHGKYAEACLYEEALYKQLAMLFRNLCVQVAHATAAPSAAAAAPVDSARVSLSTTAQEQRKSAARRRTSCSAGEDKGVSAALPSRISVSVAQPTSFGPLAVSTSAAKDSILDGLLVAIAHATYFVCVFGFPNDVYAGIFDEEFRTDVVQWLCFCCHGVVTTHVQTKHWPVPTQADYDAAQEQRSAAERRELAVLGLQKHHEGGGAGSREASPDARLPSSETSLTRASGAVMPSAIAGRRTRSSATVAPAAGISRGSMLGRAASTGQRKGASTPPTATTANVGVSAASFTSGTRDALAEESMDLENIVANAEFRLAHQFDRYSRAAVQHVSELERRMARLQRRHRLNGSRSMNGGGGAGAGGGHAGGGGGGLRRQQSFSHLSRHNSSANLSRANASTTFNDDEDDTLGLSMRSLVSFRSRRASLVRPAGPVTPTTATSTATKTTFAARVEGRPPSAASANKDGQRRIAPSFPLLDDSAVSLLANDTDGAARNAGGGASKKQKGNRARSKSNAAGGDVASARTPQGALMSSSSRRRQSSVSLGNGATSPRYNGGGHGKGGSAPRPDPRAVYRTSAFVKNDRSLVGLAAELNRNARHGTSGAAANTTSAYEAPLAVRREASREGESAEDASIDVPLVASVNDDAGSEGTHHRPTRLAEPATTTAASLLSSYPLCTCATVITEYWLATLLRVSSWWAVSNSSNGTVRSADFAVYVSPTAAAAAAVEDGEAESAHVTGGRAASPSQQQQQPKLFLVAHEPWRGVFGRIVAVPPISGAAQRAARLVDQLAESLPHQQAAVYHALQVQQLQRQHRQEELRQQQQRLRDLTYSSAAQRCPSPLMWSGFADSPDASAAHITAATTTAATAALAASANLLSQQNGATSAPASPLDEPNLGTATIPFVPPLEGGLGDASVHSASVAAYLRRRGVGDTYEGCTSPFFQLYTSACAVLTLSTAETAQLRKKLDTAREKRREAASATPAALSLGGTLTIADTHPNGPLTATPGTTAKNPMALTTATTPRSTHPQNKSTLSRSQRAPEKQTQDVRAQQVLASLLPPPPPPPPVAAQNAAATAAAAASARAVEDSVPPLTSPQSTRDERLEHRAALSSRSTRRPPRASPHTSSNSFAITAIPREEAKLRPCRMRPLQDEALRRRTQLLADMETIEKRDGVARQSYVVQQLRLANAMALLKTDTMLRRYRARGRLALERLEVEDAEASVTRDGGERSDE